MTGEKQHKNRRWNFQINLGPLSIILWGMGILFFLGWIFTLGIFVGRGLLPSEITDVSELKGEINKIQQAIRPEEKTGAAATTSDDNKAAEPELVFYDKLTTKKDEARDETYPEPISEVNRTVSQPVKPVATQTTAESDKVKPPADSTPKSSASGQFTVQIASFPELEKAEKTVKQLIEKGFNAYYYETVVKGKKYYRVRCGKFPNRAAAEKYQKKTGLKGYVTDIE